MPATFEKMVEILD